MTTQRKHRELDDHMDRRRIELDMEWQDLARAARISVQSLLAIRKGKSTPRDLTKSRIERALRWESGSMDRVLDGGAPTPLDTQGLTDAEAYELTESVLRFTLGRDPSDVEVTRAITQAGRDSRDS